MLGGLIGGISGAASAAISGKSVLAGAVTGAASGAVISLASIIPILGLQIAAAGLISAASDVANQYWNYKIDQEAMDQENSGAFLDELDWASVAVSAAMGAASSLVDIGVKYVTTQAFSDAPNTVSTMIARTYTSANITVSRTILQVIIPKMIHPNGNPRTRQQMVPVLY